MFHSTVDYKTVENKSYHYFKTLNIVSILDFEINSKTEKCNEHKVWDVLSNLVLILFNLI